MQGKDVYLYDTNGKKYLDFAAGIAVNALGHSNGPWIEAITLQVNTLTHVSNLFHTLPAATLAETLCKNSFADRVFFCNSGTEANEAAMKFCRKYALTYNNGTNGEQHDDVVRKRFGFFIFLFCFFFDIFFLFCFFCFFRFFSNMFIYSVLYIISLCDFIIYIYVYM